MAKKRKDSDIDDGYEFKIPKFDVEKYISRERRNIKTTLISFLLGVLLALVSFGFWVLLKGHFLRWELVLIVGIFNATWLKYLFLKLNIDLSDFGRKEWFTSYAIYFLTWLLVFIVLVNPPFYDDAPPLIDVAVLPTVQEPGGTILIVAHVTDNTQVKKECINLSITDPTGEVIYPDFLFEKGILKYTYTNPKNLTGEFRYSITAMDVNKHVNKVYTNQTFKYSEQALQIISSQFQDIRSGDPIIIKADEDISRENFRVYYRIDNGSEINVNRRDKDKKDKYETTAEYEGWTRNANHTLQLYVEVSHYFINVDEKFTNIVKDTTVYLFRTDDDPNIGSKPRLVEFNYTLKLMNKDQLPNTLNYMLPYPRTLAGTPGFEIIIFILAMIIVTIIRRRYKKA
ncbi:MAG: hypothetical protein QXS02_00595 [Candidatus Thermoplasmatota archaeon]